MLRAGTAGPRDDVSPGHVANGRACKRREGGGPPSCSAASILRVVETLSRSVSWSLAQDSGAMTLVLGALGVCACERGVVVYFFFAGDGKESRRGRGGPDSSKSQVKSKSTSQSSEQASKRWVRACQRMRAVEGKARLCLPSKRTGAARQGARSWGCYFGGRPGYTRFPSVSFANGSGRLQNRVRIPVRQDVLAGARRGECQRDELGFGGGGRRAEEGGQEKAESE
ncbi:hypothetical protein BGZ63DRAFT_120075 [Mariannaea sp. PMI_226]|nr:hypothetical protein BGZ63DRAFT_120075 [Mariannaea sp. PMI_226]